MSLGALLRIFDTIKQALRMPHRRQGGELDLRQTSPNGFGLSKEEIVLLTETVKVVEEQWKV